MDKRIAHIEFENIDSGIHIFIRDFSFYDFEDTYRIWNRAYERAKNICGTNRITKNIRMIRFKEIITSEDN